MPDRELSGVAVGRGGDPDFEVAAGVTGIFLADGEAVSVRERPDGYSGKIAASPKRRVERELNLLPVGDFSDGLTVAIKAGALEIAEVADIVGRLVDALEVERRLIGRGELDPAREDEVEDDVAARIGFAPHAKILVEAVCQAIRSGSGTDREPNRAGGAHVG